VATSKAAYGTATSITVTLASLANNGSATSSAIDNTTNLFLDANVEVIVVSAASGTSATGYVEVFAKASIDNADFASDTADRKIGTIGVAANATTYKGIFPVASAFGGVLPPYWQVRVRNATGAALAASGNAAFYRGIHIDTV
jgi:hypothetical protein